LSYFKRQTGFAFSAFSKSRYGYNIALLSKKPLKDALVLRKGLDYGVIVADVETNSKDYCIALTHLSPIKENRRLEEMKRILKTIRGKRRVILLGDLNSISPQDVTDDFAFLKMAKEKGIKKFGRRRLRKDLIQKLLDSGFVDTLRLFTNGFEYSVPSKKSNMDAEHFARLRLDYAFVTKDLKNEVRSSRILRNNVTDTLSDHYPLLLEMK
jgi:exodeoxyribonuclease-3